MPEAYEKSCSSESEVMNKFAFHNAFGPTMRHVIWTICEEQCYFRRNHKEILLFFTRPEHYNDEVLSHSFICLQLPHMVRIVLMCNIDLYCVTVTFNGHM